MAESRTVESVEVRLAAVRLLTSVVCDGKSLGELLATRQEQLDSREAALLQELTFGVARWCFQLDALLNALQKKPLRNKDSDVKVLLWLALYEIKFMRTPDYAVVNSYTSLTRKIRKQWAKGLINATLREFLRQREALESTVLSGDQQRFSLPGWIVNLVNQDWPEKAQDVFAASNERAPLVLRVNRQRLPRADYLQQLQTSSITARCGELGDRSVIVDQASRVTALPGFEAGQFAVQDSAAQLAAELLNPQAGERVLDACAAPGGKTCHLLELQPEIELLALDNDENRLQRVRDNLHRLQLTASCQCADAAETDQWWDKQQFDAILLDAPCSALGVLRRHPDIRLLRRESDIQSLVAVQQRLLVSLWETLKPGGRLIYATCSVSKAENEHQIAEFLKRSESAAEQVIDASWGQQCVHGRQILPGQHEADGFYYAILVKYQA